ATTMADIQLGAHTVQSHGVKKKGCIRFASCDPGFVYYLCIVSGVQQVFFSLQGGLNSLLATCWGPHAYFQTLGDTQSNTPMTHAANPLSIRSMEAEAGYIYTRQQAEIFFVSLWIPLHVMSCFREWCSRRGGVTETDGRNRQWREMRRLPRASLVFGLVI
ncbi:hypothetical protein GW17_00015743, partial [Ensete ventricosum]